MRAVGAACAPTLCLFVGIVPARRAALLACGNAGYRKLTAAGLGTQRVDSTRLLGRQALLGSVNTLHVRLVARAFVRRSRPPQCALTSHPDKFFSGEI